MHQNWPAASQLVKKYCDGKGEGKGNGRGNGIRGVIKELIESEVNVSNK